MTRSFEKMSREEAIDIYRPLGPGINSEPQSELERQLREYGIADVSSVIQTREYQEMSEQYSVCIEEHPEWLGRTAGSFDDKGIPEDGHVRKEIGHNAGGMQVSDPKSLFQFNDNLWAWWKNSSAGTPEEFRNFMDRGFHLKDSLEVIGRGLIGQLDQSYQGMNELYFPRQLGAVTLRFVVYDPYKIIDEDGNLITKNSELVAKPHYDRGGATLQILASEAGLYTLAEGEDKLNDNRSYPPYGTDQSQFFMGEGHRLLYGEADINPIQPLFHGVERILPVVDGQIVERAKSRYSAISFYDYPDVDMKITSKDTQPQRTDIENLDI